jgi:cyanophycin synthetase
MPARATKPRPGRHARRAAWTWPTDYAIGTSTGAVVNAAHGAASRACASPKKRTCSSWAGAAARSACRRRSPARPIHIAVGIASDKQLTKTLLDQAGVPVPDGHRHHTAGSAARGAPPGGPVTIKPLDANQGKGVTTSCSTPEEVERAFAFARKYGRHVIVEEFLRGRDYRVLVTGNKIAAASWRRPPHVTGDGVSSVRALVELENRNPARGDGHTNILTKIPLDDLASRCWPGRAMARLRAA